jgi:NADPH:quinone reductase-like Zn-dependent oxidoreductase
MKAVVYNSYGSPDGLTVTDVPKPTPSSDEVLIRVHAVSINSFDWRHLRADPFIIRLVGTGLFNPKRAILGGDIAGVVESVGEGVTQLKPGDEVFGGNTFGGLAEYVCAPPDKLIVKPTGLSFEQASTLITAGLTALQALRVGNPVSKGSKVLVNGASGGVGIFAVQLARFFGAEVTGVCRESKVDLVRAAGAHHIIDYNKADVTRVETQFDKIIDIAAYRPLTHYKRIMKPDGNYLMIGGAMKGILHAAFLKMAGRKNMGFMMAKMDKPDLEYLAKLTEDGLLKIWIDKIFPLAKTREAFWYFEKGNVRGKIVIDCTNHSIPGSA